MIRILPFVVFAALIAGCSDSQKANKRTGGSNTGESQNQPGSTAQPPVDRLTGQHALQEMANAISQLTQQAKSHEAKFEFKEAADVWQQIHERLAERYGPASWQAANAYAAHQAAVQQSNFSGKQLEELRRIGGLQQQVAEVLKQQRLEEAVVLARQSSTISEQLFGRQSILYGKQLIQLATFDARLGNDESAIVQFHDAIQILHRTVSPTHPDIELAHSGLAAIYLKRGKFQPAIANQKSATKIAAQLWGETSLAYAAQANQLGVIFHKSGQFETALKVLKASEAIRRRKLGAEHALVGHSLLNIGIVYLDQKDLAQANSYFSSALEILQQKHGADDPLTRQSMSKLATVYMLTGQPQMAQPLLEDLVQALKNSLPADHVDVADYEYRLAIALSRQGKYEEAEPLFKRAVATQQRGLGASNQSTLNTMRAYALLLERTNRGAQADALIQRIEQLARDSNDNEFRR